MALSEEKESPEKGPRSSLRPPSNNGDSAGTPTRPPITITTPTTSHGGEEEGTMTPLQRLLAKDYVEDNGTTPGLWQPLGSDSEVALLSVHEKRSKIVCHMTRKQGEFGGILRLTDKDAHAVVDCRPYKDPNYELRRLELDKEVQAVPLRRTIHTQTHWNHRVPRAIQYEPIERDVGEQAVLSEDAVNFVQRAFPAVEWALRRNEVLDIDKDDLAGDGEGQNTFMNNAEDVVKESNSFTNVGYTRGRMVTALSCQKHRRGVVAAAYSETVTLDERMDMAGRTEQSFALVWTFEDVFTPQLLLETPGDMLCMEFDTIHDNLLAGGCMNGKVVLFDLNDSEKEAEKRARDALSPEEVSTVRKTITMRPRLISTVEGSHTCPITDLVWLPPHAPDCVGGDVRLATCSPDGQIRLWTIESTTILWAPKLRLRLQFESRPVSPACMSFSGLEWPDQGHFLLGTEEGQLIVVDAHRNGSLVNTVDAHAGPVVALERSPFHKDMLLAAGDWSFTIWKDDIPRPLFTSMNAPSPITCAIWSATRPAVIFVGRRDGNLEVWDLLERSHEPSSVVTVTSCAVTTLSPLRRKEVLLVVGDSHGTLHILDIPWNLRRPMPNEERLMGAFYQQEIDRVQYMSTRMQFRADELKQKEEEMRARARLGDDMDAGAASGEDLPETKSMDEATQRAMEEEFRKRLGLVVEETSENVD